MKSFVAMLPPLTTGVRTPWCFFQDYQDCERKCQVFLLPPFPSDHHIRSAALLLVLRRYGQGVGHQPRHGGRGRGCEGDEAGKVRVHGAAFWIPANYRREEQGSRREEQGGFPGCGDGGNASLSFPQSLAGIHGTSGLWRRWGNVRIVVRVEGYPGCGDGGNASLSFPQSLAGIHGPPGLW